MRIALHGITLALLLVTPQILSGCCSGVRARDTAGIKACLNDVASAEMLAVRAKRWSLPDDQLSALADQYDSAVTTTRHFLNEIHVDASLEPHMVDVSTADYEASPAARDLRTFIDAAGKHRPLGVADATIIPEDAIASLVSGVIVGIGRLCDEKRDNALATLRDLLRRGESLDFEAVTSESLREKYIDAPPPS